MKRVFKIGIILRISLCLSQDQYQLHVGEYTGTGEDALADALNPNSPCSGGIKFSTFDHPNYINAGDDKGRCIRHSKSGWWFCR